MPAIGRRCHELRVRDADHTWRIVYRMDPDAVVVLEALAVPGSVILTGDPDDIHALLEVSGSAGRVPVLRV